jgi:hypothetical protein
MNIQLKTLCRWVVLIGALALGAPVQALTLEVRGNLLFATGEVGDDLVPIQTALKFGMAYA